MKICRIKPQDTMMLRHAVLWPDESVEFCYVEGDEHAWHFGAYIDDELISVASVYLDNDSARLRKFATAVDFQGKGIGTKMLGHILEEIKKNDVRHFWCDARESALGFYKRFGLASEGCRFYKGDIPYLKMSMTLAKSGTDLLSNG